MSTRFCDGISEVTLISGVARLEFYRRRSDANAQPLPELTVALPVEGFLQVLSALERFREKLVHDGVLTQTAVIPPK